MMSRWEKSKEAFQKSKRWQRYGLLAGTSFILIITFAYWFNAPGVRQCTTAFDFNKCFFFGQSLWGWLELLGVPLTLALLGYFLQQRGQKRSEDDTKEEVLQAYYDRLSSLLVEQNLLATATKLYPENDKSAQY